MGVVTDATTDEGLVMLLEDTRKRDDEAAGTMLDTDVLREGEVEASIAEVGNAEACTGHSIHRSTLLSVAGLWKQVMLPSYSHTEAADNNEV